MKLRIVITIALIGLFAGLTAGAGTRLRTWSATLNGVSTNQQVAVFSGRIESVSATTSSGTNSLRISARQGVVLDRAVTGAQTFSPLASAHDSSGAALSTSTGTPTHVQVAVYGSVTCRVINASSSTNTISVSVIYSE